MQISLKLGSHNRKKHLSLSNSTTVLDLWSNHGVNRQLRGRAINCNVTDGFYAQVSSKVKKKQAYKEIIQSIGIDVVVFMPPKELWEAYSNRTVRPSVSPSVFPCVRPSRFVSDAYLLHSLR